MYLTYHDRILIYCFTLGFLIFGNNEKMKFTIEEEK